MKEDHPVQPKASAASYNVVKRFAQIILNKELPRDRVRTRWAEKSP
jgi:hypothetical protein